MSGRLNRRVDALEQAVEEARVRDFRRLLEDDARRANMHPHRIADHVERLLAVDRQARRWLAAGVSRDEILRRCAVMVGLDPEAFAREAAEAWERERGHAS